MKVLLIGPFPKPIHGMSLSNENLYMKLQSDNVNISKVDRFDTVFDRQLKSKAQQGTLNVNFLIKSLIQMFKLIFMMLVNRYDIVYITPGQSVLGFLRFFSIVIISRMLKSRVIQHIHGSRLLLNINKTNFIMCFLCFINVKLTNKFVFLSKSTHTGNNGFISKDKISYCMNGVEMPAVKSVDSLMTAGGDIIRVLFLSNLMVDKGVLDLFAAIDLINAGDVKFEFDFAGDVESGIEYEPFFNDNYNCNYHGVVFDEKKEKLLKQADVFILPSYDEGVPLSILEAYAYSCAVITTNVGGIPDIFDDGINGIEVIPGSINSIFDSLNNISSELNVYKVNNHKLFLEKYSIDIFYMTIKKILLEVG